MFTNQPILADLHWLLTSPSLIAPHALPPDMADGNQQQGNTWWQALAGRLDDLLAPPIGHAGFRLGRYAEFLLGEALARLPDVRLLASQLAVQDGGRSLGEYDFLVAQPAPQPLLHIELAVKFFIALPVGERLYYVGPALRDSLEIKLAHLFDRQLRLSQTPAGRAALPQAGRVSPMAWLRGRLFYPASHPAAWSMLASDHLRGWWRRADEAIPSTDPKSTWRVLAKPNWLAPDTSAEPPINADELARYVAQHFAAHPWPLMLAEYAPIEAGGKEMARGMVLPANWPPAPLLEKLTAQIDALH